MQGLNVKEPEQLELKEYPDAKEPEHDEVKVKLIYGGICGSDVGVYKGKIAHASYPVRPGHELIGMIAEAGEKAPYTVGERVVVEPNSFCGACEFCQAGKTNICKYKKSLGVNDDGGFAETFTISAKYVLPVPETLPSEKAVLIEPLAVIVHALEKVKVEKGVSVAVIGCGTEGMLTIAMCDYAGADITAIDISEEKLAKVNHHYPDVKTLLPSEAEADQYDIVVEAAGASASFEQGVEIVKPGGDFVVVGMAPQANVAVIRLVRKEVTIYGSIIYTMPHDFEKAIAYLNDDAFRAEPVISKIYPFQECQQAYDDAVSGRYGKILLDFQTT